MATGRRKCICQICTCGKHICPHRKHGTLATHGLQNGGSGDHKGLCLQDDPDSKDEYSADQTNGKIKSRSSQITRSKTEAKETHTPRAKRVSNKGNGQGRWSAKQIPKTMAIRHPDNLKSEGSFDLTTTHQHDYAGKTVTIATQHETDSSTVANESWNERQVSKTLSMKKPDNLRQSGSLDLRTTHSESYREATIAEAAHEETVQRKIKKRPKTSLRTEGSFRSETLYQKDFSPRKQIPSPKHRPTSNLKPEGSMYFKSTSSDYNADVFQSKLEDEKLSPRSRKARPQSNLKPAQGPLVTQTTNADYKIWNVERSVRKRPEDTLKRIPAPESIDENEILDQIKKDGYRGDYAVWKVHRPTVRKPSSNIKSEGALNFETTHATDYTIREHKDEISEVDETRLSSPQEDAVEKIYMSDENDQQTELSPSNLEKGDEKEISEVQSPETLPISESSEIGNYINKEQEIALSEGSGSEQMLTWEDIRPQPIRPQSNLRQYGDMRFDTTNRREFIQRPIEKVKGFRPQTSTKISGEMETMTTNQIMLKGSLGEKVSPIRPKSNLHLEEGTFNDETTSAREFQKWVLEKPKPIRHKSTLTQEGDMTFTTTHHTEFEAKSPERVYPIRPKTTSVVYDKTSKFDDTTTNSIMHQKYESEKVDSIRPESNLKPNSGSFYGETTNRREFQKWEFDRMSPIRPHTNMRQEGDMDFTTMNQVQFRDDIALSERPQPIIHPTNLHVEDGQFSDETTTHREFQNWHLAKSTPFTPRDNLTQGGEFDFTTVNQTQFFEKPIQREVAIKPKSSSKIIGEFDGTTTNQIMFKNMSGERPHEIRPKSNLKVEGGKFWGETTTQSEYQPWELVTQDPIKPRSSVRYEDDFDGVTTNQMMYKNHPYQKLKETRPHTNIQIGKEKFNGDTTNRREFQQWRYSKSSPVLPQENLTQEGEMDFVTLNQSEYGAKQIERIQELRPHTTNMVTGEFEGVTTNRSTFKTPPLEKLEQFRHQDNLRIDSGDFNGETTARREYVYRATDRPEPIKPKSNLTQEGDFDFTTSNQKDFETKPITKVSPIRPHTMTKLTNGDFYGTTTNQEMYTATTSEPVKPFRPQSNLRLENGEFHDNTTAREEYQSWKLERPAPVIYSDTLKQEGDMEFETTNRREFIERSSERPEAIRPKTSTKIEGEIDTTTTNQVMYPGRVWERVQPIRQKDNLFLETGKFDDETTNRREFRQKVKTHSRTKIVKPLRAAGVPTQGVSSKTGANIKETKSSQKSSKITMKNAQTSDQEHVEKIKEVSENNDAKEVELSVNENNISVDSEHEITRITEVESPSKMIQKQSSKDYGSKPMARVKAIISVSNIIQEGEMDFSTTTKSEYTEKLEQSKLENVNLKTEYQPWKLSEDNGVNQVEKKTEIPTRPMIHRRGTLNGKSVDMATTTEVSYKAAPITAPKRFKPSDNLKPENVPFDADSTTRTEFKKWETARPSPQKRSPNLKQEGEMQFSTTAEDYSRELFNQHGKLKPRTKKPQENLKLTGDMNLSTTTQSSYVGNSTPKTKTLRPKSSLRIGGDSESKNGTPPSSIRHQTELTTDITKSTFVGNVIEKTRAYRPTTSQKIGEGKFENMSTTQREYKPITKIDKTKSFKPESSHVFNGTSDEFQGNTTYRCTYDSLNGRRCPVLDLESNKYQFTEEVNGHRFYLPLVSG